MSFPNMLGILAGAGGGVICAGAAIGSSGIERMMVRGRREVAYPAAPLGDQRAMAVAMIYPEQEKGGRGKKATVNGEFSGVSQQRISEAAQFLRSQ